MREKEVLKPVNQDVRPLYIYKNISERYKTQTNGSITEKSSLNSEKTHVDNHG